MQKRAYIKAISYYLPTDTLTNEDIHQLFPEWSVEKVASKVGINTRHIAGIDETALDMAEKACENLFNEHNIDKSQIDFILLCTQSPDYFLPTSACILQNRLGLSTKSGALDFNLGCSGFVYGLSLAKGLICGGISKNILLVTSETYTKHIHPQDKGNRTIFGDAAAATLINTEGFAEILNFSLGTDGEGAENLIIKNGGLRNKKNVDEIVDIENPISDNHLYMNGTEIFNFTLTAVPPLVNDILEQNRLKQEDINLFILHQANQYMLEFIRKKIKIEQSKFYYFMQNVGNTVSSTIPLALKEAQNENRLSGQVLIAGFGVGYSWGGVVLNCSGK